jgi:hypothetical protein
MRRQKIGATNGGDPNEMLLFHGSRNGAYDVIMRDGFDHRVANMSGAIGAGIYFAPVASTSLGYVDQRAGSEQRRMLLCRVTVGNVGRK